MSRTAIPPIVLASVLASAVFDGDVVRGQVPEPARSAPQITFRSTVELVTVSVSVRDDRGRLVRNLERKDFEVLDDGRPREIRDFHVGDSAISLAVLLDISGSMAVGGNIDRARNAVAVAMRSLGLPTDEAALYTFDSQLQEVVKFTTDLDRIRRVSLEGKPWGQTSLFDAVAHTARQVADRANRHRAVLVITDGVDTASKMRAAEVSGIASSIDVPVYLLTVVNPVDHPGGEFGVLQTDGRVAETATLADLARWTGGDMRIASMPEHTIEAIGDLFLELRYQYILTFEPGARAGWHPLEIRTRKKNLVVHARSGYTAGPSRSS